MKLSRLAILAMPLAFTACDNDPGKGKPQAIVQAPTVASAPAPEPVASATPAAGMTLYPFNEQGSKIEFVGAKITRKHPGAFGAFRGSILVEDGSPAKGRVKVEIDMPTLAVDVPKLTHHLQSTDFFDVAKFPRTTFISSAVDAAGPGKYSITGRLDLHGVTKSITFPATIRVLPESLEADSEFVINRKDFGVAYPGAPDDLIEDNVLIKLTIRAKKG